MSNEKTMPTWMIVEDEPDIYTALLALFEMWGIDGVAFVSGEEAVAWVDDVDQGRFRGALPQLALVDIRLPGDVDGLTVGARLRQSPILGEMSIVLSTAYRLTPEQEAHALEKAGADRLLYKPFRQFRQQLEDVIAYRQAMRTQQMVSAQAVLTTGHQGHSQVSDASSIDPGQDR